MSQSLNPEVWGPHYWFFLHTATMCYPISPTKNDKKRMYEFITNLPFFFPRGQISTIFHSLLDEYPLAPYLDSKDSIIRWMHFIHNKVNHLLKKPKISLSTFYERYYDTYKEANSRCTSNRYDTFWKVFMKHLGKVFYFIIIALAILWIRRFY